MTDAAHEYWSCPRCHSVFWTLSPREILLCPGCIKPCAPTAAAAFRTHTERQTAFAFVVTTAPPENVSV